MVYAWAYAEAHIQHIQLSLSRRPCFPVAGTDHGGVKRSIGEIVDTDEPSIPRKKKYAVPAVISEEPAEFEQTQGDPDEGPVIVEQLESFSDYEKKGDAKR